MTSRFFPNSLKLSSNSVPSFPGSLEASTHRFHDCPSIASGLGRGLRSPTVAMAAAEVVAAPVPPSSGRGRRGGGCCRWGCRGCGCCCRAAAAPPAARRGSPLTSSAARSDILSAPGGWPRPPGRPVGAGPAGRRCPRADPPPAARPPRPSLAGRSAPRESGERGSAVAAARRGATQESERAAAGAAASSSMTVYPAALWEFDLRRQPPPQLALPPPRTPWEP